MPTEETLEAKRRDAPPSKSMWLRGTLFQHAGKFALEFYDRLQRRTVLFKLGPKEKAVETLKAIDAESDHGGPGATVDAVGHAMEVTIRFSPGKFMKRFYPPEKQKPERKLLKFSDVMEQFFATGCYRELVEAVQRAFHAGLSEERFSSAPDAVKVVADEATRMIRQRLESDLSAAPEVQAVRREAAAPPPLIDRDSRVRLYVEDDRAERILLFVPYEVVIKKKTHHLVLGDQEDHSRILHLRDKKVFKDIAELQDTVADHHAGDDATIEDKNGVHKGHIVQVLGA